MAIKIPARNYLTFSEVQSRWECTENDLRYAIISGELKPSVRIDAEISQPMWGHDFLEGMVASDCVEDQDGYTFKSRPRGWQYLQEPSQIAPFDCRFKLISDDRDAIKPSDSDDITFTIWGWLPKPMTLDNVKFDAVFLLKEIARFEEKHGDNQVPEKLERPLASRERDTLLCIIAALCKEAKFDYTKHAKTAGMIQSTAAGMEVSIGETTIENHLKRIPNALAGKTR